jgi:hypothetical protein
MKLPCVFASLLLSAPLVFPANAATTIPCGKRVDIIKMLSNKFSEEPRAIGIDGNSTLVEIFASKAGTWTIVVTRPNGSSCVVGAGDSWEEMPPMTVSQQTRL